MDFKAEVIKGKRNTGYTLLAYAALYFIIGSCYVYRAQQLTNTPNKEESK